MQDEKPVAEETPAPPPKNFFRKHTFLGKGPNRREVRDYLLGRGILAQAKMPADKASLDKYFADQRAERFPEEVAANLEVSQKRTAKQYRRVRNKVINAGTGKRVTASDIEKMRAPRET